jgi:arginase family enzyme
VDSSRLSECLAERSNTIGFVFVVYRPVSFLMGLTQGVPGFEWVSSCLSPDRIAYIGLRDVDEGEQLILKEKGIAAYSMTDVDRMGIHAVMEDAMKRINPDGTRFVVATSALSHVCTPPPPLT